MNNRQAALKKRRLWKKELNVMGKNRNRKTAGQEPPRESLLSRQLGGGCLVELSSDREALVEGCTGILEYDDGLIRLNTKNFILQFTGSNLQIQCMSETGAVIVGQIRSLEYIR